MNTSTHQHINSSNGTKRKSAHYHNKIAGAHSNHQNAQVLRHLQEIGQPTTARMLHKVINAKGYKIDLVSLRRCCTNLFKPDPKGNWKNQWGRQMIREAIERPCPITHITVAWYEPIPDSVQINLFQ